MASRQRRISYNENLCTFSIKTVQVNTRTSDKQGLYLPVTVKEVQCTGTTSMRKKTCCETPDRLTTSILKNKCCGNGTLCVEEPRRIDVYKMKVDKKGNYIFVDIEDIVINVQCSCHKLYDN